MKKIICLITALILLLSLVSCSTPDKTEEDNTTTVIPGLIDITVQYIGEDVTTTTHEFKTDDFRVLAAFKGEEFLREVHGYTFETQALSEGYYILRFEYGGCSNQCYIPIKMNFYPSDRDTYGKNNITIAG